MQSPEALIKLYRRKGLRITAQRRLIFEILAEERSHPTVEEIYQRVKSRMPEVSRSTVYNTVHELVELGELFEVEDLTEEGTRYDTTASYHYHLFCKKCHKLIDIEPNSDSFDLPPEKASGFKVQRSQVTFYGICSDCQERNGGQN